MFQGQFGMVEGGKVGELVADLLGGEGVAQQGVTFVVGHTLVVTSGHMQYGGSEFQVVEVEPWEIGMGGQ